MNMEQIKAMIEEAQKALLDTPTDASREEISEAFDCSIAFLQAVLEEIQ